MASAYPAALDTLATNKANATATTTDHPTHHNDLADAVNKIEAELGTAPSAAFATVAARFTDVETNVTAAGTPATSRLYTAATANANNDEFPGAALSGWTTVQPTGNLTITVAGSRLSALYDGQSSDDLCGVLKSLTGGIATGDYIQTYMEMHSHVPANYNWIGLGFADGAAASSNVVMAYLFTDNTSSFSAKSGLTHGTLTAMPDANVVQNTTRPYTWTHGIHFRLLYVAANSFQLLTSSDGITFSAFGGAAAAKTLTPTHGGLIFGSKGSGEINMSSFEYFRTNVA